MLSRTDINRFGKITRLILKKHTTHSCKQKCLGFLENCFTCCQLPSGGHYSQTGPTVSTLQAQFSDSAVRWGSDKEFLLQTVCYMKDSRAPTSWQCDTFADDLKDRSLVILNNMGLFCFFVLHVQVIDLVDLNFSVCSG